MTDLIELAKQAGLMPYTVAKNAKALQAFADLIRQDERDAVISMPLEMAMADEFSRFQLHDRAQELLKQVHSLEAERDRLREALAQITGIHSSAIGDNQAFKSIQGVARQALEKLP